MADSLLCRIDAANAEWQPQPARELAHRLLVRLGFIATQTVIHVSNHELEVLFSSNFEECMEESDGIDSARNRHQQALVAQTQRGRGAVHLFDKHGSMVAGWSRGRPVPRISEP
jgi:hypothetical protein